MTLASETGARPELKWIAKDLFVVDHHYQRHTKSRRSQAVIESIRAGFQWALFQPPTVTPGPAGRYLVIDGQHRIEGAVHRPDITELPCYVLPSMDVAAQARAFVEINRNRVALSALHVYRASLTAGDPECVAINNVCEEAGVSIARYVPQNGMSKPGETMAIGTIRKGIKYCGEDCVIAALMVLHDAFKITPGMMRGRTLYALMRLFKKYGVRNVDRDAIIVVLKKNPPPDREAAAAKWVRNNGGRVDDAMFNALAREYMKEKGQ